MNTSLLPNPLFDYMQLFNLLLPVSALLVAVGLLLVFQQSSALPDQLRGLVQVTAIVAFLASFDSTVLTTKKCVKKMVEDGLKAKPQDLVEKFVVKLMSGEVKKDEGGFWSKVANAGTVFFHALLAVIIIIVGLIAMALFFLAYLAQEMALELGIGLSPIFVGFLLLPSTRSIGVQFLLYMLAIALFPLGWGAASLVSDRLIDFATNHNLGVAQDAVQTLSFSMRNFFGTLLLSIWMILSTVFAPFAILRGVTSGVHLSADAARAVRQSVRR